MDLGDLGKWTTWVKKTIGWTVEVVQRPGVGTFRGGSGGRREAVTGLGLQGDGRAQGVQGDSPTPYSGTEFCLVFISSTFGADDEFLLEITEVFMQVASTRLLAHRLAA